ncbi:MAG TPA: AmmeMemoRadiSam system radical SAM enzyme [Acidobacteriota bacterium]|nr:AmmeMemoRadiSam system radical SAM enzyme [Acidobacteriota bacterium]
MMSSSYEIALDERTQRGELWATIEGDRLLCYACGHRCKISAGRRGICKVRFNVGGELRVPHGYVAALQCDPIEKKPFFHVTPGSTALTFGMLGCDYHCGYCQNWNTSQALRDAEALGSFREVGSAELVSMALRYSASMVTSSYNEPLITAEWAVEVFRRAKEHGLRTSFVSNGNATEEALNYLQPWLDCYKVDLKSMRDKNYRQLGGRLSVVLDTIRRLHQLGVWLEVVTLVVPGFNDSEEELREAASFIASVSKDIPWHVTAFHPDYKMRDRSWTQARQLLKAVEIGKEAGLNFVYAGNLTGAVGEYESTFCPQCGTLLVAREGYRILENHLVGRETCPRCSRRVPGIWN